MSTEFTDQAKKNLIPLIGQLEDVLADIEGNGYGMDSDRYQNAIWDFLETKEAVWDAFPELSPLDLSEIEYEKVEEMIWKWIHGKVC